MSKNTRNRILLTALAALLLVAVAVGGTMAWLVDNSDTVTNTFTETTINVTLTETTNEYEMVPGREIEKDPKVTLATGSEESYVFVKITQSENFEDYMNAYEMAVDGNGNALWEQVGSATTDATTGAITKVWMYKTAVTAGQALQVLKDNAVTVKESVTKARMDAITNNTESEPTLVLTAYAIQTEIIEDKRWTSEQIWELAQDDAKVEPTT